MSHRTVAIRSGAPLAAALLLLGLAACADAGEPTASPSASPSTSPSPSAAPSTAPSEEPAPEPTEDPTAGWARTDVGWASVPLPDGWTIAQDGDQWMVRSDAGLRMVQLFRVPDGQYAADLVCPEPIEGYELLDSRPYEGAGEASQAAWDAAGMEPVVATTARRMEDANGPFVLVEMGISSADLVDPAGCYPFFAVTPSDGVATGIVVVADPIDGLDFATMDEAVAYTASEEHATLVALLQGIDLLV